MELFLDRGNPLHWALVAGLLVSGVACAAVGIRDGLVRRDVRTNAGRRTGGAAVAVGLLYVATGLAGVAGALAFLLRGR